MAKKEDRQKKDRLLPGIKYFQTHESGRRVKNRLKYIDEIWNKNRLDRVTKLKHLMGLKKYNLRYGVL